MKLNKLLAALLVAAFAMPVLAQNAPASAPTADAAPHAKHKKHYKHNKKHKKHHGKQKIDNKTYQGA